MADGREKPLRRRRSGLTLDQIALRNWTPAVVADRPAPPDPAQEGRWSKWRFAPLSPQKPPPMIVGGDLIEQLSRPHRPLLPSSALRPVVRFAPRN
uniref:Uncharacterized protein n=1 Tax=Plectus sambesii TaxID=2011161 RepID=A0A914UR17_9BILA